MCIQLEADVLALNKSAAKQQQLIDSLKNEAHAAREQARELGHAKSDAEAKLKEVRQSLVDAPVHQSSVEALHYRLFNSAFPPDRF